MRIEKKTRTTTGLPRRLKSSVRSDNLHKLAVNRGIRLRSLRLLLHLTIEEFAKKVGINPGTMGRLERHETCLPIHLAKYIARFAINNGVLVTSNWLLHGVGENPQVINKQSINLEDFAKLLADKEYKSTTLDQITQDSEEYELLGSHLIFQLFSRLYPENHVLYVKDYRMAPVYKKGEILYGVKINRDDYNKFSGRDVIVELDHTTVVRILSIDKDDRYFLTCYDHLSYQPELVDKKDIKNIYDIKLNSINSDEEKSLCDINTMDEEDYMNMQQKAQAI